MNPFAYLALACAGLCGAAASILLKTAASLAQPAWSWRALALAAAALVVYGASFLLYGYSLRFFQVGVAYVGMVAVAVLALLTYSAVKGAAIGPRELLGVLAVLIGVLLINWKRPS